VTMSAMTARGAGKRRSRPKSGERCRRAAFAALSIVVAGCGVVDSARGAERMRPGGP
jgi:hypothetical protein